MVGAKRSNTPRDPRPQSPAKLGPDPTDANSTSTCHAPIDTGATTTMIVEKVVEALDLDLDKLDTVEVRGFDGQVVGYYPATDSLWVSVPPFDPAKLPEVVIVPDNTLNYQAIVGMDYLERFKIAIRHGRRALLRPRDGRPDTATSAAGAPPRTTTAASTSGTVNATGVEALRGTAALPATPKPRPRRHR